MPLKMTIEIELPISVKDGEELEFLDLDGYFLAIRSCPDVAGNAYVVLTRTNDTEVVRKLIKMKLSSLSYSITPVLGRILEELPEKVDFQYD